jgi:glucokinase
VLDQPAPGLALGIDVGGTKVAAGLVGADGSVLDRMRLATPAGDVDAVLEVMAEAATGLAQRRGLGALPVGVGAAGLVDLDGVVRYAPNLAWRDEPLRARLAARLPGPILVENDANVAAWGEYRIGAGTNAHSTMVMLTIGTGVGGGLILGDQLMRGAHGFGAEFGHIVLDEGGPLCRCGIRGDLESLASGTAIGRMAAEAVAAGEVPGDSPLAQAPALNGKVVTVAAHAGDPVARRIMQRAGFWLGVGIVSLVNALDPELVVVGGGAMQAGELLLAPARAAVGERLLGRGHREAPPIVRATLADAAGFIGAALLALERHAPVR